MPHINYLLTPTQACSSIVFSISISGNFILSIVQSPILNNPLLLFSSITYLTHQDIQLTHFDLCIESNHFLPPFCSYPCPSHQLFSRLLQGLLKWSPFLFSRSLSILYTLAKPCYSQGILHKSEIKAKIFIIWPYKVFLN